MKATVTLELTHYEELQAKLAKLERERIQTEKYLKLLYNSDLVRLYQEGSDCEYARDVSFLRSQGIKP